MVGQNRGARQADRAEQAAWRSVRLVSYVTITMGILMFLIPEYLVRIFINDPEVVRIGAFFLRILSISQFFMGLEIVLEGAFSGAGNTIPPMCTSIPLSFARIPLAYVLAYNCSMGIQGVWWAISMTSIIRGTLIALWFRKNRWKTRKL